MPRRQQGPQPRRVTITRWVDQFGQQVPKNTPGAKKVRTKSETYYVKLGGVRHPLHTTDLRQAHRAMDRLQKRLRDEAAGIATPQQDQAMRPLADHLAEFCAVVRAKGTGGKEVKEIASQVTRLAGLAGWQRITQITADSCRVALARVVTELGRSQQTRNHYLRRVKAFSSWLTDTEPPRLLRDPLRRVRKGAVTERPHRRRIPTDAEVQQLMQAIDHPGAPIRRGMTGPQRALGYRLTMATGFRANELRSLTRDSFDLAGGTVALAARVDKRRKGALQPLPPWLVAELSAWFAVGGTCWEGFPEGFPGRLLQDDLKAAGVPYTTQGPEGLLFFDFHSLRAWFVSWAANHAGISPKTLMELARHSTPQLTLDTYAQAQRGDMQRTVADLPDLGRIPVAPPVAPPDQAQPDTTGQTSTPEPKKWSRKKK